MESFKTSLGHLNNSKEICKLTLNKRERKKKKNKAQGARVLKQTCLSMTIKQVRKM